MHRGAPDSLWRCGAITGLRRTAHLSSAYAGGALDKLQPRPSAPHARTHRLNGRERSTHRISVRRWVGPSLPAWTSVAPAPLASGRPAGRRTVGTPPRGTRAGHRTEAAVAAVLRPSP